MGESIRIGTNACVGRDSILRMFGTILSAGFEADGVTVKKRNGIPKYFITKFSYQDDYVTLRSPHILRLAEVYLNRRRPYAKDSRLQLALDDINADPFACWFVWRCVVRVGRSARSTNGTDAVLQERRLELAYEGHRAFDVYQNKKSMDRSFQVYTFPKERLRRLLNTQIQESFTTSHRMRSSRIPRVIKND